MAEEKDRKAECERSRDESPPGNHGHLCEGSCPHACTRAGTGDDTVRPGGASTSRDSCERASCREARSSAIGPRAAFPARGMAGGDTHATSTPLIYEEAARFHSCGVGRERAYGNGMSIPALLDLGWAVREEIRMEC